MKTKDITEYAILLALAFVCSYLEAQLPILVSVPGVKLGLANIMTMLVFYRKTPAKAYIFMCCRVFLTSMVFSGIPMLIFSFAGGSLCILMMWLVRKLKCFSMLGVSMMGAVFHNVGQIAVACFVMENAHIFYYLPVLCMTGLFSGFLIGYISYLLVTQLNKNFPKDC